MDLIIQGFALGLGVGLGMGVPVSIALWLANRTPGEIDISRSFE